MSGDLRSLVVVVAFVPPLDDSYSNQFTFPCERFLQDERVSIVKMDVVP